MFLHDGTTKRKCWLITKGTFNVSYFSFRCVPHLNPACQLPHYMKFNITRIDVYETLCPKQMLVHKGGEIKNWGGGAEMSHLQNCSVKIFKELCRYFTPKKK